MKCDAMAAQATEYGLTLELANSPPQGSRLPHSGGQTGPLYVLDYCALQFGMGEVWVGMDELFAFLFHARRVHDAANWAALVKDIRDHPVTKLVHQCAIAQRAFARPRGYPGDAVLIDHLYGCGDAATVAHPGTLLGQIYSYLTYAPATRAVRFRRWRLAQLMDAAQDRIHVTRGGGASIVSLAAGHLREFELTRCYRDGDGPWDVLAVDQDAESLAVIDHDYGTFGVRSLQANVKEVVTGALSLRQIDLIYAAGLFDYLATPFATKLAKAMFDSLRSGGTLLLANFLPNIRDVGFMEAVMDWWLIYRIESDLQALLGGIAPGDIAGTRLYRDPDEQIVFLEAVKR